MEPGVGRRPISVSLPAIIARVFLQFRDGSRPRKGEKCLYTASSTRSRPFLATILRRIPYRDRSLAGPMIRHAESFGPLDRSLFLRRVSPGGDRPGQLY